MDDNSKELDTIDKDSLEYKFSCFRPEEVIISGRLMGYKYGSKGLTQALQFQEQEKFSNPEIDYYMGLGDKRLEKESYKQYKLRLKFQKALYKYRSYLYKYADKKTK